MTTEQEQLIHDAFDLTKIRNFKEFSEKIYMVIRHLKCEGIGDAQPSFVFPCKSGSIDIVNDIVLSHYKALWPGLFTKRPSFLGVESPEPLVDQVVNRVGTGIAVVNMVFPVGVRLILIEMP